MDTKINDQLARIKSKLTMARKYETDFKAYGASTHKYLLNPPAEHSLIEAFEEKFEVSLPEEYVGYLTQLGNGGAGPQYGITPLTTSVSEFWAARYAQPFKMHPRPKMKPEDPITHIDPKLFNEMLNGLHYIGEFGYTITCLIVKGEEKGRVAYIDEEGRCPPSLAEENSFLDWYECWVSGVNDGSLLPRRLTNVSHWSKGLKPPKQDTQ